MASAVFTAAYSSFRKHRPLTEEQLLQVSEQPIAVLIPAWDEAPVIRHMLENTLRALTLCQLSYLCGHLSQ